MEHVVVVGAGHAGVQVADSLRAKGYQGALTVVDDDGALPYQRPPLSKDFIADAEATPLPLRARRFFEESRIGLMTGVAVQRIDRRRQVAVLADGDELDYTALVLATGAETRTLDIPGADLRGVVSLRTLADAQRLRARLGSIRSAVVVGAGFIGLEFASAVRCRGVQVTVLEAADRPLGRALSSVMSDYVASEHRRMGTDLQLGEGIGALTGHDGAVTAAIGASGREYVADLVVLGVGVVPRDRLAREAGLHVDNGIVVDPCLQTSDPRIFAVGDCASFPVEGGTSRLRIESVQNASDQGRHVADSILGVRAPYEEVPWFWSNQGAMRLQIAGLTRPGDRTIVSGDRAAGRFSVFCVRDDRLVAVESLNRAADHIAARQVLARDDRPSAAEIAAPDFDLKGFALRARQRPENHEEN